MLVLRVSRSVWTSGVGPRGGIRAVDCAAEDGLGEGILEGAFTGATILDRVVGIDPFLDSAELVRL